MNSGKKDPLAVEFMVAFQNLRDRASDDPKGLQEATTTDEPLKLLCGRVWDAASMIQRDERSHRRLYRTPVSSIFIELRRDYEARWRKQIARVKLIEWFGSLPIVDHATDTFRVEWENADDEAAEIVGGMTTAMEQALNSVEFGDFPEGYPQTVGEAASNFQRFEFELGVDLRGIFRRRTLVPMVLVPAHVSNTYGNKGSNDGKVDLYLQLQVVQEAFVLGLPLAALSHGRALIQLVLERHYGLRQPDQLEDKALAAQLPELWHLANDVLHAKDRTDPLRKARLERMVEYALEISDRARSANPNLLFKVERDLCAYLTKLGRLIEDAPRPRRPGDGS